MTKKLEEQLERERKLKVAILGEDMQGFLYKKGKSSGKMQRRLFYLRYELCWPWPKFFVSFAHCFIFTEASICFTSEK